MSRLWGLAINTFREAVRDRVLYSILFFGVGVIFLSLALEEVTIGDQEKVVRSVGQAAIDAFGSIIAMFLGVSLVWKELDKKTIYTILSKPIPRWMFVVGKYLGLMLTLVVEIAILLSIYCGLMVIEQSFPPPVVFVSMALLLAELMLLTAWATLFSCYSAPMTASAFTLAIFCIGHLADDVLLFGSQSDSAAYRQLSQVLYWVLPNFEIFNIREHAVHELPIPWERVWPALAYSLSYTTAVLGAAVAIFQRRDL
ncbi:MAG: ABC-type transport system involved in multi-copper enzyme maturation permease subunit [Myxococcota bacterium]|jgi:ABC-type transport system involved in multi-copper enzyme maturation permease subunit